MTTTPAYQKKFTASGRDQSEGPRRKIPSPELSALRIRERDLRTQPAPRERQTIQPWSRQSITASIEGIPMGQTMTITTANPVNEAYW